MRVAVSSSGDGLDAPFSPVFGRCPYFVMVDSSTMAFQAVPNVGISASGGAGIQAAQDVVEWGAQGLITGNVGPNAHQVLSAARIPVYQFSGTTVREAVEAFRAGRLALVHLPGPAHAGMRMRHGQE